MIQPISPITLQQALEMLRGDKHLYAVSIRQIADVVERSITELERLQKIERAASNFVCNWQSTAGPHVYTGDYPGDL